MQTVLIFNCVKLLCYRSAVILKCYHMLSNMTSSPKKHIHIENARRMFTTDIDLRYSKNPLINSKNSLSQAKQLFLIYSKIRKCRYMCAIISLDTSIKYVKAPYCDFRWLWVWEDLIHDGNSNPLRFCDSFVSHDTLYHGVW